MAQGDGPMVREIAFGAFVLIESERRLLKEGQSVEVGGRALDLLLALTARAGEVVSRRELVERVWPDVTVEESSLRAHVRGLRKALGDGQNGARYITNVPGRGYCFVAPVLRIGDGSATATNSLPNGARRPELPPRLTRIIGRDDAIAAVSDLVMENRFVSVFGAGGMGKTTVALAVAHSLATRFDNAVYFVDLGTVRDGALVPTAVASAVGCLSQVGDPMQAFLTFVADKHVLIVLDSCEHLIDSAATLAERLFKAGPQVHLLITTRETLRVEGENVYLLPPLQGPDDKASTTEEVLASPAVQLFVERAGASGHRVPLSDEQALVVAHICSRLDGIALAIELAASRIGTYGIQGTADLLGSRFPLQWHGRRTAAPRHQTLRGMLDWSFSLLSDDEQGLLCRSSVFVDSFTQAGALAVAPDSDDASSGLASVLASLVTKSLLCISHHSGAVHYRLLDTTRAYAAERLAERGQTGPVARSHGLYCAHCLRSEIPQAAVFAGSERQLRSLSIGDVRAALEWSFSEDGDPAVGTELAALSVPLFLNLSLPECERWCERALSVLTESYRGTDHEAALLEGFAISSMFTRGNSDEVKVAIDRGLRLAEVLGDRRRELHLLAGLNIFNGRIGDFGGALAVATRSLKVAEQVGEPAGVAMAEWMVGAGQHTVGKQAEAQYHCERGLEMAAASDAGTQFFESYHRVRGLAALARALWLQGLPERAVKIAHQAVDEALARNRPIDVCLAYIYTAHVFLWIGDLSTAQDRIEHLIAHAAKYSLAPYHAVALALKGELLIQNGHAIVGVELLQGALTTLRAERYRALEKTFARALAEGLARAGRLQEAMAIIRGALAAAEAGDGTFELPDLLRTQGEILLMAAQPDLEAAEAALIGSIECAKKQSALGWEMRAAIPLAQLWSQKGRATEARAMLTSLLQQYREGLGTADPMEAARLLEESASFGNQPGSRR
jgi:predicted ATPase/DNA-binding winged helix-turn-helix (wHTH) protein